MDYRWQVREFSTEPLFLDLIFAPNVLSIAEQLIGDNMVEPPVPHGKPMGHLGPNAPLAFHGVPGVQPYCHLLIAQRC